MRDPPREQLKALTALVLCLCVPSYLILSADADPSSDDPSLGLTIQPGWVPLDGLARTPEPGAEPVREHVWPMSEGGLLEQSALILRRELAGHFFGTTDADLSGRPHVYFDRQQHDRLVRFDRETRALYFGVEPLARATRRWYGLQSDGRSDAFHIWRALTQEYVVPLDEHLAPDVHRVYFQAAVAADLDLPRDTLEEEYAVALFSTAYLYVLLREDPEALGLRTFDSAMRRQLGEEPPDDPDRWHLDPLPASADDARLYQSALAARELSFVAIDPAVPELWRDLRAAAGGTAALRAEVAARRPGIDRLSQDWGRHLGDLRARHESVKVALAAETEPWRRQTLTREEADLARHIRDDEGLAADPDRVRRARLKVRDGTARVSARLDQRKPAPWKPSAVAESLATAYSAVFAVNGAPRWAAEAIDSLRNNDVTLDLDRSGDRLAAFMPGQGEIRIGLVPFLRRLGVDGRIRQPGLDEIGGFSQRLVASWEQAPSTLQDFASETAPVVFHELSHAALNARVALPFQCEEEETAARLRTVLFLRERLRARPNYLNLADFDRLVREKIGGERGDREWWRDPLTPAQAKGARAAADALRESFHPHVPTLWLDLRTAAGGLPAMRGLVTELRLEALDQDWKAHMERLGRLRSRLYGGSDAQEHHRRDEAFLRNPVYLEQARNFYRDELARLARELE